MALLKFEIDISAFSLLGGVANTAEFYFSANSSLKMRKKLNHPRIPLTGPRRSCLMKKPSNQKSHDTVAL